jgi:AcrR family transcriptional regulator
MATGNPEATKRRILTAARREFVRHGIAGARMERIAQRARTSKRLPFYYFQSKTQLYGLVVRAMLDEQKISIRRAIANHREILSTTQREYLSNTDMIRMHLWEALEGGERARVVNEGDRGRLLRLWIEDVELDQQEGRVPKNLDPAQLVLSYYALLMMPTALPQLTRMITGMVPSDPDFADQRAEFLRNLTDCLVLAAKAEPTNGETR